MYKRQDWVRDAIVIAFYTGLREGEIFALKWSDIDLNSGFIMVQNAISKACSTTIIKGPKTPAGVRRVDICLTLTSYLKLMKARVYKHNNPYVFPARCV